MPKLCHPVCLLAAVLLLVGIQALPAHAPGGFMLLPPDNDNCDNATLPVISNSFDYGTFSSEISDLALATGQVNEFFQFAPNHTKSVWFTFSLPVSRSVRIEMATAPGSAIVNPTDAGVTVYFPSACLPGSANRLGAFVSSGDLYNPCLEPGAYRIQITGVSSLNASVYINITLGCPDHLTDSRYDCPSNAFVFNGGIPLPSSANSGAHSIACHSIEDPSEYDCLPLPNKAQYLKSAWYVFTTGSDIDLLSFDFDIGSGNDDAGYRLLEGNVRNASPGSLPQVDCGVARRNANRRFVEFPCILSPNTTYSLALLFHTALPNRTITLNANQRGLAAATGWPMPVLPPVSPANQLGILPGSSPPGTATTWSDRFECSSYISANICPPANPASGEVVIGGRTFDLATWATFTLEYDANVEFRFTSQQPAGTYYLRIFNRSLGNTCPSPDPATDLYDGFPYTAPEVLLKCMPAGDYALQVLSSTTGHFSTPNMYRNAWDFGCLGTAFTLRFTVVSFPADHMFLLDAPGAFDAVNNLDPLQNNVVYPSTPAVFVCESTVLPEDNKCLFEDRALYRQIRIGDADGDGIEDEGLLTIRGMRTDLLADPPIAYSFHQGDADQLATAAGAHTAGQTIPGLTDYAGFCIEADDFTVMPAGIDNFCTCVTPGVYTLASLGDVDNVGKGDAPDFRFSVLKTIHDSRANAELIAVDTVPGNYFSGPDVFSCLDNPGEVPPCGDREKLIFREFYLEAPRVITIAEAGNTSSVLSLFSGRASDLASTLTLVEECFANMIFIDFCTPFEPGWYTVVSYGRGPNFTNRKVWNTIGNQGDVGRVTRLSIIVMRPIEPMFNRPEIAYQGGITDWVTPPLNLPNANTSKVYGFPTENFCEPDTPFIADSILPCTQAYNRVAFYVFEITKPSFVQILGVNSTFYTVVFPFDVEAEPGSLLTKAPVYPCVSTLEDYRQLCDLPPGKYTIAIFANDTHKGRTVTPSIYVEEAGVSRFDHAWNAYDFDVIPSNTTFVNGRTGDMHPFIPGQAPSRDVFYCTTGAAPNDPLHTQCATQRNPLVYAQPDGTPKPLFLPASPPMPFSQPWRNLWYTFMLSGAGECTVRINDLSAGKERPFIAVYESPANAAIPWSDLQTTLANPANTIIPGLQMLGHTVITNLCNSNSTDIVFTKSACSRDSIRYYVMVGFDAFRLNLSPNLPNQVVSLSVRYEPHAFSPAYYDERATANVINGLMETAPPYTSVPLVLGDIFTSTEFSLLCYTRHFTDPPGIPACTGTGKSAWFAFEAGDEGQVYIALERQGPATSWFYDTPDLSLWYEAVPGGPMTRKPLSLIPDSPQGHPWSASCVDPGRYFLLVRDCISLIDDIAPYRVVLMLTDSPGDFCSNAIPVNIISTDPVTGSTMVDCHTIGTDIGEILPAGNSCFTIPGRKTTWYHAIVNTGTNVDLRFQLVENFTVSTDLNELAYRILAGSCGAMTPIACSATGTNDITLNCLGQGSYYIQVSIPERSGEPGNPPVEGLLSVIVTATPSDPQICTEPLNPNQVVAEFDYITDCTTLSFINLSTAGIHISYLWQFPDNTTSTDPAPVWTPPASGTYDIRLIVTNTVLGTSDTIVHFVTIHDPFFDHVALQDTFLCNGAGSVVLNATVTGPATYLWENNSPGPLRVVTAPGTYSVIIMKDGCELRDTVVVTAVDAGRTITATLCPGEELIVAGQVFDIGNPNGTVILPQAHPSGCDSILTVTLAFLPFVSSDIAHTICEGEVFSFGGTDLTQPGVYHDTLVTAQGCDSIVTLTLGVTPTQHFAHTASDCIGEVIVLQPAVSGAAYVWGHGPEVQSVSVTTPGAYTVSVTDTEGCLISEETFEVAFGLLPAPVVPAPHTACMGEDVTLTADGSLDSYRWFDSLVGGNQLGTGPSLLISNVQKDTTVYVEAFREGVDGCVSPRVPVMILLSTEPVQFIVIDTLICAGHAITLPWGETVKPDADATYTQTWYYKESGCDSLHLSVRVTVVEPQSVSLPSVITIVLGDSVRLVPQIGFEPASLAWSPADGLSCDQCREPWAKPFRTTNYQLTVWSPEGCIVTATVRVEVSRDLRIYIPNVFSPNGDNINDIFTVFATKGQVLLVRRLLIFDRWGGAIWRGADFFPDGITGWDGISSHRKIVPPGVYVWLCELDLVDGSQEVLSGDVTLVR